MVPSRDINHLQKKYRKIVCIYCFDHYFWKNNRAFKSWRRMGFLKMFLLQWKQWYQFVLSRINILQLKKIFSFGPGSQISNVVYLIMRNSCIKPSTCNETKSQVVLCKIKCNTQLHFRTQQFQLGTCQG